MPKQQLTDYISVDVRVEQEKYGGMGRVYMGSDHHFHQGQWRALKTLHPSLLAKERGRRLFLNECLTWVGLWPHPNLLSAQSVTEINNELYLILDYAEHGNLRDQIERFKGSQGGRPLPLQGALETAQHIAAGLVALHTPDPNFLRFQPIVHRDLKPENILFKQIDQSYFAQITDFGLAKIVAEMEAEEELAADADNRDPDETNIADKAAPAANQSRRYRTKRGAAMGTFPYMPPEQWVDAASAGPPADLYAFGVILGEIMLGRHPLLPGERGEYAGEDQWRRLHFQARPPALAAARDQAWKAARAIRPDPPFFRELTPLFEGLLAKRPEERPTAAEALAVLQQAAAHSGSQPYTPPEITPLTPEQECGKWNNWAISFFRFQRYQDALDRNDRALALASTHSTALLNRHVLTMRGNILGAMGNIEEALACYDRALESIPESDASQRAAVLVMRATHLDVAGDHEQAEEAFTEALRLEPSSPVVWHNRANNERLWGDMLAKNGQHEEAALHWRRGLAYVENARLYNPDNSKIIQLRDILRQSLDER